MRPSWVADSIAAVLRHPSFLRAANIEPVKGCDSWTPQNSGTE